MMSTPTPLPQRHYLWLPVAMLLLSLIFMQLPRLLLLFLHPDYFANTDIGLILRAILVGLRFDLATVVIMGSVLWLCLLLPFGWVQRPLLRMLLAALYGVLLLLILAFAVGDGYYFGEVSRHAGKDLLNIGADIGSIGVIIWQSLKLFTALGLLAVAFLGWIYYRTIIRMARAPVRVPNRMLGKIGTYFFAVLMAVWLGRGLIVTSKPLSVVDAFALPTPAAANLAINGMFALMQDISRPARTPLVLLKPNISQQLDDAFLAKNAAQSKNLGEDADPFAPLFLWQRQLYKDKPLDLARKNVVLVLLESWSYGAVEALGKQNYHATPFMDSLVAKSQVWDHFYAAGQRSILGIQAIFTSVPILPNHPALGTGLELNNLSQFGYLAREAGYQTIFMQTSPRRSFHVDGIANLLGFERYYGKEDVPIIKQYPDKNAPPFGWDYDSLMFLHRQIDEMTQSQPDKPFFASIFTGTTHIPFADPGKEFHIRPHDKSSFDGFLNTLRYSDWALEQFMQAAAQSPWYKDTVFIFLADHVYHATVTEHNNTDDLFHIPLIIFAPDGSLPPMRHHHVASQYDLLPTLMDLIHAPQKISAFGRSLFDDIGSRAPWVLVSQGELYSVIAQNGWAGFNGLLDVAPQLSPNFDQQDADRYRQDARFLLQHADQMLRNNQWLPKSFQAKPPLP